MLPHTRCGGVALNPSSKCGAAAGPLAGARVYLPARGGGDGGEKQGRSSPFFVHPSRVRVRVRVRSVSSNRIPSFYSIFYPD